MALSLHFQIMSKFMQVEAEAANQIRAIACGFGTKLPVDFKLTHLTNLPIELIPKIVVKLMETRCSSLRREAMEVSVLMIPALHLYLAMRPTKVDLTAFLSFSVKRLRYQDFKQTVIGISEKAADIEELSLLVAPREHYLNVSDIADVELLQALANFKRLKVLRIEKVCAIKFINLIGLCQRLPDLDYLHFNIADDILCRLDFTEPIIADELKNAMPKLKVFLFDTPVEQKRARNALTKVCAENLPNLRVIQAFSSVFSSYEDYASSNEITQASGNSSNLRHLLVQYDSVESFTRLPLAYPLITHLKIVWSTSAANEADELKALLQLAHLESLEFTKVPQNILRLFVEKFGANLLAISFHDDDPPQFVENDCNSVSTEYSLGRLLALCPKLEKLEFMAHFKVDLEPIALFSNLKDIRIFLRRVFNNQHIRLTDILRAPNLEKITFDECDFDVEDLRNVSSLIREKKILGKLKELNFSIFASARTLNADYFKEVAAFIKCVAASLPTISIISLDFYTLAGFIEYALLARSFAIGKTTNDEIDGINQFFGNHNISSEFEKYFVDEEMIAVLKKYRR